MATDVERETELSEEQDPMSAEADEDELEEDGGVARLSLPGTWQE